MPQLTLNQLKKAVAETAKRSARRAEAIRVLAKNIQDVASDTTRVAENIGARHVDTATVAETVELAKIMAGLSEASIKRATAGQEVARAAQAVYDQAQADHGGFQEAVRRAPVDVSDTDREWFRQQ
jgi:hypothetical protein